MQIDLNNAWVLLVTALLLVGGLAVCSAYRSWLRDSREARAAELLEQYREGRRYAYTDSNGLFEQGPYYISDVSGEGRQLVFIHLTTEGEQLEIPLSHVTFLDDAPEAWVGT